MATMINGYKENQELQYVGKGFLGFDPKDKKMNFVEIYGNYEIWVVYKGQNMIVRKTEVI